MSVITLKEPNAMLESAMMNTTNHKVVLMAPDATANAGRRSCLANMTISATIRMKLTLENDIQMAPLVLEYSLATITH